MPRKSQRSVQREADRRLSEGDRASARLVDLQIDWVDYRGRRVGRFGGVWDRTDRCYVGDAATSRVIRLHDGQLEAARWFVEWLTEHLDDDAREANPFPINHALFAGGRRGGKTTFGIDALCAYSVALPEAICNVVTPSNTFYEEPIECIEREFPKHWYESLGEPHWTYYLLNGSRITLRSGYTPRKLKKGRADFIFLNEAQQLEEQAMTTVLAGAIDAGGLMISAANPPDVGDEGVWVATLAAEAKANRRKHARFFFFNPEKNPEISQNHLAAMKESMGRHEYRVQILGEFLLPPDSVLYDWATGSDGNELEVPDIFRDITLEFTKAKEGRAYTDLVAVDVQNYPWHAAGRYRVFDNPDFPGDFDEALIWQVGEAFVSAGDEVDVCDELKELEFRGQMIDPDTTLVVMDASGDWQQAERDPIKHRKKYRGRGSMSVFRGEGFRHVVPPDHQMDSNPEIADRCRAANARICTASGRRLVFVDPERCPMTVASVRKWRTRPDGTPSRKSNAAHGGDMLTYLIWRFFPRRKRAGKLDLTTIEQRFEGRARFT